MISKPLTNISNSLLDTLLCPDINKLLIGRHFLEPRVQKVPQDVVDDCLQETVQLWLARELSLLLSGCDITCTPPLAVHLDPVKGFIGGGSFLGKAYFERRLLKEGFESGLAEKFLCF